MSVKISICIVAYHNHKDILNAVESIEIFTNTDISKKIYIVDNDETSTDENKTNNEIETIKNSIRSFPDVEYISVGRNIGFGKGHNYILSRLDSEYHAIVNPDILLQDDALLPIIDYLDCHNDVGMVVPRITDANGKLQEVYRKELTVFDMFIRMFCRQLFPDRIAKHTLQDKDYTKAFQVPFAQGSFLVVRTSLLKDLKGFDDKFFMYIEDADLCRRVNLVSKLMFIPDSSVIHKWEKGSHKNMTLFKFHIESMRYYFKKWGVKWI